MKKLSMTAIVAWCFYDWACASYGIIIVTFVFSTYFTTKVAADKIMGTFLWGNATSLAGLIIAFSSPLFGAIADYAGQHNRWLAFFTWLCIIPTSLLWFAYPNTSSVYFALTCVVIGTVGYEIAQVFYNAFLPFLTPVKFLGRVSGWGWGSGYLGGIVALSIMLIFFVKSPPSFLPSESFANIRICGPFVGLWYAIFSLPLFLLTPSFTLDVPSRTMVEAIQMGSRKLWQTLRMLPKEKNILLYLISHMVYTDGLNTLFAFGGIYAAGTFGLTFEEVLYFGISMNLTAGFGAIALGWVDDYLGSKLTVLISLFLLVCFGSPLLLMHNKYHFWLLALLLCALVGPVQSASRSLMVRLLTTKTLSAEMFGLYALSGKITAFLGPWFLGYMTYTFNSQRAGMAVVLVFLLIGALLLLPVKVGDHWNLNETEEKPSA